MYPFSLANRCLFARLQVIFVASFDDADFLDVGIELKAISLTLIVLAIVIDDDGLLFAFDDVERLLVGILNEDGIGFNAFLIVMDIIDELIPI